MTVTAGNQESPKDLRRAALDHAGLPDDMIAKLDARVEAMMTPLFAPSASC
jgi:hypothetical protein